MAQLVARGVWDAEVASSSLVAPTIQKKDHLVVVFYVNYNLRTCGTSQGVNASSSLVAPTIPGGKIKKIYFLYLTDAEWKDFAIAKDYHSSIATIYMVVFLFTFSLIELAERPKG